MMRNMQIKKLSLILGIVLALFSTALPAEVVEFSGIVRNYQPAEKTFSIGNEQFKLGTRVIYQSNDGVSQTSQKMLSDGKQINGTALKVSKNKRSPAIVKEIWFNN